MRENKAAVSVVIPTFNRAAYLRASIDSILEQTHAPPQVIVVDDGSTDETGAILETYGDRVTVITKTNGGKPSALNEALPRVTGDYLWVFDDDDVACPDALARHVAALDTEPAAGFTFSGAYRCSSQADSPYLCVDSINPARPFPPNDYLLELLMSCYVASPCAIVRTSIQKTAGPYQEDLARSEDFDMALRWGLLAPAVRLASPEPTYFRRTHAGLRGPAYDRFDYSENIHRSRVAERLIIRRLEKQLTWHCFLPRDMWHANVDTTWRQRAHLRQVAAYCAKGMWPEAADAVNALAHMNPKARSLPTEDLHYLRRACAQPPVIQEMAADDDVRLLRHALGRARLPAVRQTMCLGIVQQLQASLMDRESITLGSCAAALGRVIGLKGTAASLSGRLLEKVGAAA